MGCACRNNNKGVNTEQVSISSKEVNNTEVSGLNMNATPDFSKDIALEPVTPVSEINQKSNMDRGVSGVAEVVKRIKETAVKSTPPLKVNTPEVVEEAIENDLKSCYLCAKKHLVRAQIFFEEYHTGYPDHIKNLVQSLRVAEVQVRSAFLRWQKIMGHLDMAANELLGNDINAETMSKDHIILANKIRDARIRLSDNPLVSINFDELITKVHLLQYKELEKQ